MEKVLLFCENDDCGKCEDRCCWNDCDITCSDRCIMAQKAEQIYQNDEFLQKVQPESTSPSGDCDEWQI